jgi:hypothetical protein
MSITRHDDGSLTVPVEPGRHDEDATGEAVTESGSMVIRPGEGGYNEALAEWENEQHPDRGDVVSTASGRQQAMAVVHAIAQDPDAVTDAVDALDDPTAAAEALTHVLVGGTPSVEAFAAEVAEEEGGDAIAPHIVTRIIGEVLADVDARTD